MTYTIDCFKNLIEQYPTWAQLRPFLESWEGGRLRIIDCGSDLHLVRYDKGSSNFSIPSTGWFRSVVWNGATNRPLCVGPPKATETEPESRDSLIYEEFYEGVMINAFLEDGHVRLVTRSKLDATGTFYSPRSFQSLLMDTGMTLDSIQALLTERGAQFVSLLLQHPEHRIVSYITEPRALVIHTGSVDPSGSVTFCEDQIPPLEKPADMPLEQWARSIAEAKGWQHQGLVIKDGQGSRYRLRSSAYTMVRTLRGDSPRLEARFLKLRQQQLMETYGFYYPEEKPLMAQLELLVRQLTQQLYNFYVCVHIKHSIKFVDLPPYWKTHVYALHSYYLGTLKERRFFIRKQEVIQYMNNLPIPRMLHLLKLRLTPSSTSLEHEQSQPS
jgi:hypothetical protein